MAQKVIRALLLRDKMMMIKSDSDNEYCEKKMTATVRVFVKCDGCDNSDEGPFTPHVHS